MAQDLPYRTSLLSLYKNVMSLHRKKLPEQLRTLADDYVRTEFKSMKAVKKSVFVEEFMKQWNLYARTLRTQQDSFGTKMKKMDFEKLDSQQQGQLRKLKSASLAAAAQAEGMTLGEEIHPFEVSDEITPENDKKPL